MKAFALIVLLLATAARADAPPVSERVRELYAKGDYEGVRRELQDAYEKQAKPELLFALGQVELQLGNYAAAIEYYERFITTSPPQDQIALAQQAIGAARMRLKQPPPPPPEPRPQHPPREWYLQDTVLVAIGGAAALGGGGALIYGQRLGNDHSGTLSEYDERLGRARSMRWVGVGFIAGGAIVAGVAIVRWRLRPDGGDVTASISPAGIGVTARW